MWTKIESALVLDVKFFNVLKITPSRFLVFYVIQSWCWFVYKTNENNLKVVFNSHMTSFSFVCFSWPLSCVS
jgi:hypothetical protein